MQKVIYRQADLHHEEVIELDSPWASFFQTGTQVHTFLLLGDQNAGKSTFLHSFTYEQDLNFLSLTSYLPMLSTTFINSRFLGEEDQGKIPPLDEPPFIDTDLARATVLLTLEDFLFLLQEFGLPIDESLYPRDARFAVLQFIEIGKIAQFDKIIEIQFEFLLILTCCSRWRPLRLVDGGCEACAFRTARPAGAQQSASHASKQNHLLCKCCDAPRTPRGWVASARGGVAVVETEVDMVGLDLPFGAPSADSSLSGATSSHIG